MGREGEEEGKLRGPAALGPSAWVLFPSFLEMGEPGPSQGSLKMAQLNLPSFAFFIVGKGESRGKSLFVF